MIKLIAIFLLVAIPFLNCGSPKHSTSSATLSSSDIENLVPQGKALYLQNCASCHGPYDTSDKLGRTQAQIQFAIQNVPQMSHLSGLNTLQIRSLSAALIDQANGGSIIAGPSNRLIFSCQPGSRPQTPLVKLNNREYRNSISDVLDLFDTNLKNDSQLVDLFNRIPSDIVLELDHTRKEQSFFINGNIALASFEAAFRAGALVSASSNLGSFINTGGCLGQSSISASCHQSFIRELGAIAFRRPLSASEVTTVSARFFDNTLSKSDLIQMTVTGLLQSPDFLYKVYDRGSTVTSSANALQITAHEFASKISYFLTGAPPDSTLRNLANSGAIFNNSIVDQEVERLLNTARSRVVIGRLFQESYGYDVFTNLSYPDFYLQGINTNGLQTAMITELDQFFSSEITTQNATFSQLLTSRRSQFSNSSLAQIYQSSTGTVELPAERSGFLNRAAFLTKRSGLRASPIKRGLVVLENVLCSSVGLPPPSAPTSLPDLGSQLLSTRDVTHRSTAVPNSSCIACHGRINPLGYAFENFDTLGRVRSVESIYDSSNNLRGQVPVNTNASSNDLGPQPVSYTNSVNLSTEIGRSDKAILCFAQHVKSFESRRPASASDNCHMNDFVNTLYGTNQNQGSIKDAIKNYIISDQFKQWNY